MFRTVLLLFCISAAIYGALGCSSSKKKSEADEPLSTKEDPLKDKDVSKKPAEPDEALSTKEDPLKDKDVSKNPAQSAAAPVIEKDPPKDESTSENPVQSFNGIGCYLITNKVNNEVKLELKQNIKMSHRVCALECARKSPLKRYKYFRLANGENCLCTSELPRNSSIVDNPEVHCSYRCPGNHLQSCGGENAAAYFSVSTTLSSMRKDKFEQGAKVYPVI
uniref:WSC domain-containing protein n=1 Tax=Macrostomum lignano TaxID=282301 RepID=A0A1I8J9K8_9PLAT